MDLHCVHQLVSTVSACCVSLCVSLPAATLVINHCKVQVQVMMCFTETFLSSNQSQLLWCEITQPNKQSMIQL